MPGERLPMRKLRDVLRLHAAGLSKRRIAVSLDVGATSVGSYLRRARRASLSWPLPDGLSDEELERLLFPPPVSVSPDRRPLPDWPALHGELRKPAVTLSLLWEEYREVYPEGYGYSRFCDLHRAWKGRLVPTMRQVHVAGEKMFVDYAGATVEVIDPETGEVGEAQLFVATLGGLQLYLCRGHLDARLARLDRVPHPRLRFLRWCSRSGRAGQSQVGRLQSLPVRSRDQPHLCRHGGPLRHRHPAGAAAQAEG